MFELRVYVGSNAPIISQYVNDLVALTTVVNKASRNGSFDFTRAECWFNGVRQWELMVD